MSRKVIILVVVSAIALFMTYPYGSVSTGSIKVASSPFGAMAGLGH